MLKEYPQPLLICQYSQFQHQMPKTHLKCPQAIVSLPTIMWREQDARKAFLRLLKFHDLLLKLSEYHLQAGEAVLTSSNESRT